MSPGVQVECRPTERERESGPSRDYDGSVLPWSLESDSHLGKLEDSELLVACVKPI